MYELELLVAGCVLVATVGAGLVAHELAHALSLRFFGIEYEVSFFAGRHGLFPRLASCPWASVRPIPTGREPVWTLRVAALAPALLAVPPLALGLGGGIAVDSPIVTAATIGWLACSVPSPQDFSVAFYAHRALEGASGDESGEFPSHAD